jgi:hypothetical protein
MARRRSQQAALDGQACPISITLDLRQTAARHITCARYSFAYASARLKTSPREDFAFSCFCAAASARLAAQSSALHFAWLYQWHTTFVESYRLCSCVAN